MSQPLLREVTIKDMKSSRYADRVETKLFILAESKYRKSERIQRVYAMKRYIAAICFCLVLLIGQGVANPMPIRIGHGLIGNLNPHETGAIVLGSYFDPDQGTYDNYWSSEYRIFDLWRYMPPRYLYVNNFKNINQRNWHEWHRYCEYIPENISPKPLYILQDTPSS